jgi:putative transposase
MSDLPNHFKRAGILEKVRHKVDDLHKKMSTWLCRTHRVVLILKFAVKGMAALKGGKRKMNSKTAREMYTWGHYRFFQLLIAKSELCSWCTVVECDEVYTSKTCGKCGTLHHDLKGEKIFECPNPMCDYVADRDISAARNILMRFLTLENINQPWQFVSAAVRDIILQEALSSSGLL